MRHAYLFLGLLGLALICYGTTLNGGFLVDDWWYAAVAKGGGWPPFSNHTVFFRPLASLVFVVEWHLFGAHPLGYRVVSLLLYSLTAFGIVGVWDALMEPLPPPGGTDHPPQAEGGYKVKWAGVLAGALFIMWPSHAEAVAWISSYADQLAALFGILSLWSYLVFLRRGRALEGVFTLLFLIAALMSKESAVVLPVLVFGLGQLLVRGQGTGARISKESIGPSPPAPPIPRGGRGGTLGHTLTLTRAKWARGQVLFHAVIAAALIVGYLVLRTAVIGKLVGGYGHFSFAEVMAGLKGWKLVVNLCNLYLPVAKFIALGIGPDKVHLILVAFLVGLAGFMVRRIPRERAVTDGEKRWIGLLLVVGAVWALILEFGALASSFLTFLISESRAFVVAGPVIALLLLYVIIRVSIRNWDSIVGFLTGWKLRFAWIPAALLVYFIDQNWMIVSGWDLVLELALFAAFVQICYLTREPLSRSATEALGAPSHAGEPAVLSESKFPHSTSKPPSHSEVEGKGRGAEERGLDQPLSRSATDPRGAPSHASKLSVLSGSKLPHSTSEPPGRSEVEGRGLGAEDGGCPRAGYYVGVATAFFVASLIALLPSINLPINLDGQQGRFSYLGTVFSVLALVAAFQVIVKSVEVRRMVSVGVCAVLFIAAASNISDWAQAGTVSRETSDAIAHLTPTRRVYVIATPATIGAALLFVGGLEQTGYIWANDPNVQVLLGKQLRNFKDGDHLQCVLLSANSVGLAFGPGPAKRFEGLSLVDGDEPAYFQSQSLGDKAGIRLPGYKPGDHVMYIDGEGAHVLE